MHFYSACCEPPAQSKWVLFQLCATAYRRADALDVLQAIETVYGQKGYGHPNKLEVNGHKVLVGSKALAKDPG